jgi:hypothetical protein
VYNNLALNDNVSDFLLESFGEVALNSDYVILCNEIRNFSVMILLIGDNDGITFICFCK